MGFSPPQTEFDSVGASWGVGCQALKRFKACGGLRLMMAMQVLVSSMTFI
jgi:hypothetical protein